MLNIIINATGRDEKIVNLQNNQGENMGPLEHPNWELYAKAELRSAINIIEAASPYWDESGDRRDLALKHIANAVEHLS